MSYIDKLTPGEQRVELQGLELAYYIGMEFQVEGVVYQITDRKEYYLEEFNLYSYKYQIKKLPDTTGKRWNTTTYRIKKNIYQGKAKLL